LILPLMSNRRFSGLWKAQGEGKSRQLRRAWRA
jgi:hypothetical protein